jgi:hypothetical protein
MASVAMPAAVSKPKVQSVADRSLSIVFGTPTQGTPYSSDRRAATPEGHGHSDPGHTGMPRWVQFR